MDNVDVLLAIKQGLCSIKDEHGKKNDQQEHSKLNTPTNQSKAFFLFPGNT